MLTLGTDITGIRITTGAIITSHITDTRAITTVLTGGIITARPIIQNMGITTKNGATIVSTAGMYGGTTAIIAGITANIIAAGRSKNQTFERAVQSNVTRVLFCPHRKCVKGDRSCI